MKLDNKEFKEFKRLQAAVKDGSATTEEQARLAELMAKRNSRGSNDLSWWKNYPALLKDVVNLPFNWIPGTTVTISGTSGQPDILTLGVIVKAVLRPAIGHSTSDADAFNSQIRQLWLDLHRKYRGIGTYEKSDLGMAIIAIDSAFETLAKFERLYGVINAYKIGNRVIPAGLKEALGISADLEENLADFRYTINLYVEKMKQLCLPKGLGVLESDIVAISNIFKDAENGRAFLYMFDTDTFGVYDPTTLATGGCVKFAKLDGYMNGVTAGSRGAFTLADVKSILDLQIGALLNDDDIARICSDLLAAYGPANVMQLVSMPEDYKVDPIHDYERQIQFHNLTACGHVNSIYDDAVVDNTTANSFINQGFPIVIYQENNTIMCELGRSDDTNGYILVSGKNYPTFPSTWNPGKMGDVLFDTWVEEPGETEVMCGTRYTSLCGAVLSGGTNRSTQDVVSYGTKVVDDVVIYRYSANGAYVDDNYRGSVLYNGSVRYPQFFAILQMDWHPLFYIYDDNGDIEIFGDLENFTKIDQSNLQRIHEVALLSGYKFAVVTAA